MQIDKAQVLISVLVMNKPEITSKCLRSLLTTEYPHYGILIIDNGSDEATVNMLRTFQEEALAHKRNCQLVLNRENKGIATGRNQAFHLLQEPYIAFVDNDVEFCDPRWLSVLVDTLEKDENIAITGPKLLYPTPPHLIQHAGGGVSATGRIGDMGRNLPRHAVRFNEERDVQFFAGACTLLRQSAVAKAGYFDTVFDPIMFEDVDYCYRLRSLGYRIRYVPAVEAYHWEHTTTLGSGKLNSSYLFAKHSRIFKQRWRGMYEKESGPTDEEIMRFNKKGQNQ